MAEHSDKGEQLFRAGYNCAQSVFGAFSDTTGIDFNTAVKMSASFGGGFGRLREVCGAACGMTLVYGCLFGYTAPDDYEAKKTNYAGERELMETFREQNGSIICRDILGDLANEETGGAPTPRTEEFYTKRPCIKCIRTACDALDRYIISKGQK